MLRSPISALVTVYPRHVVLQRFVDCGKTRGEDRKPIAIDLHLERDVGSRVGEFRMAETLVFPVCTVVSGWVHSCVAPFLLAPFCDEEHAAKAGTSTAGRLLPFSCVVGYFKVVWSLSRAFGKRTTQRY